MVAGSATAASIYGISNAYDALSIQIQSQNCGYLADIWIVGKLLKSISDSVEYNRWL